MTKFLKGEGKNEYLSKFNKLGNLDNWWKVDIFSQKIFFLLKFCGGSSLTTSEAFQNRFIF